MSGRNAYVVIQTSWKRDLSQVSPSPVKGAITISRALNSNVQDAWAFRVACSSSMISGSCVGPGIPTIRAIRANPRPITWHKSAEEILDRLDGYYRSPNQ